MCKNHTQNSIRSHANLTAHSPHQEQSAMAMTVWQQIFPLSTVFFGRNILFLPNKNDGTTNAHGFLPSGVPFICL